MAQIESNKVILANGNLYFIELDKNKVNPVFVLAFLQSEMGMSQLSKYAKGAAIKSISINDLKRIQIPNLSKEKQDLIAEEYENLNNELIALQRKIDTVQEKRAKLLLTRLD